MEESTLKLNAVASFDRPTEEHHRPSNSWKGQFPERETTEGLTIGHGSVLENVRNGGQKPPLIPELSKTNCNFTDSYLFQAPPLLCAYWLEVPNS